MLTAPLQHHSQAVFEDDPTRDMRGSRCAVSLRLDKAPHDLVWLAAQGVRLVTRTLRKDVRESALSDWLALPLTRVVRAMHDACPSLRHPRMVRPGQR